MIDAETKEPMEEGDGVYEHEIRPQMTKAELEEYEQMLKAAAAAGSAFTILELVACLSVKKILFANWILVTALQVFVYINDWNVIYPKSLQALMKEFRRLLLGEFVDDFDAGRRIQDFFGIKKNPENTEQKVGKEKMGTGDIIGNLGISVLVISILIILFVVIVIVGVYVTNKYAC